MRPPSVPPLTGEPRDALLRAIVSNLGRVVPSVTTLAACADHVRLEGGWVYAAGRGALSDPASTLHRRDRIGITQVGSYISVDTGKYSTAPWLARESCAEFPDRAAPIPRRSHPPADDTGRRRLSARLMACALLWTPGGAPRKGFRSASGYSLSIVRTFAGLAASSAGRTLHSLDSLDLSDCVTDDCVPDQAPLALLGASYVASWTLANVGGRAVVNCGIAGNQTHEYLERFERDVAALHPRAVIIWGIDNDVIRAPGHQVIEACQRVERNLTRSCVSPASMASSRSWSPT